LDWLRIELDRRMYEPHMYQFQTGPEVCWRSLNFGVFMLTFET